MIRTNSKNSTYSRRHDSGSQQTLAIVLTTQLTSSKPKHMKFVELLMQQDKSKTVLDDAMSVDCVVSGTKENGSVLICPTPCPIYNLPPYMKPIVSITQVQLMIKSIKRDNQYLVSLRTLTGVKYEIMVLNPDSKTRVTRNGKRGSKINVKIILLSKCKIKRCPLLLYDVLHSERHQTTNLYHNHYLQCVMLGKQTLNNAHI